MKSPCSEVSSDLIIDGTSETKAIQVFKVPDVPTSKKKKKVLNEETYLGRLSTIIERDFFPDMDNLKDKLEYLTAVESNDFSKLRSIYNKYSASKNAESLSRINSPATFETPESQKRWDPGTPSTSRINEDTGSVIDQSIIEDPKLPSLDKFMINYTSEDNENFEHLMEETRNRIRLKNPWLYEAEDKHNANYAPDLSLSSFEDQVKNAQLSITGTASKERDIRPTQVENWTFKTFNSVMYPPEGAPPSKQQLLDNSKLKKKEVNYTNTRFDGNPFNETVSQATMLEASAVQASKKEGKVGVDGKELGKGCPMVNGYGFIPNPSPIPGVESSPLMTWGEVEGTPFQLDGSQTPLSRNHASTGPSYRIPKVPDKDQLVLKLVEKASQNNKDKRTKALSATRSYFGTPSTTKFGSQSSMDRLSCMSPAAQQLLNSKLRIHKGSNRSLRASYTPNRLRVRTGVNTPGSARSDNHTPSSKMSLKTPGTPIGLTDNLLELPKTNEHIKSNNFAKASDFF